MRHWFLATACLAIYPFSASPAVAQSRCDCTTIVDSCAANVTVTDTFIEVTTDHDQCARVDYFIDGAPFVSVVVEGSKREDWLIRGDDPRVLVQACQVCRDIAATDEQASVNSAASQSANVTAVPAPLEPIVRTEAQYPIEAQAQGIEGKVTVEFDIDSRGDTQNIRVLSANPQGVFDFSAVAAVSRWRYREDAARASTRHQETIEFKLGDFIFDTTFAPTNPARNSSTAPANQCIRENVSYNYGEMIEVGLINACDSVVSIFACASGTGADTELWVCSDTDSQSIVLSAPGSARIGSAAFVNSAGSRLTATVAENFYVARAPNSEYWWIACHSEDQDCRMDAKRWLAAMDRQAINVDPQVRTRATLGRSF